MKAQLILVEAVILIKRLKNVFDKIVSIDNILLAHKNARKDKTFYNEVKMVDENPIYYAEKIREMLVNNTYKVSKYNIFTKNDGGKIRKIYKLPYYPDRIIQWAIMLQIRERFEKHFIYDTYSSIPNRGIHSVLTRINKILRYKNDETTYFLKIDISKFYPSVNQNLLKHQIKRIFGDQKLLNLLYKYIESVPENEGIPIGSYLSQYLGNYFLSDVDHYCKEILKIKYYYRYMDDIVIFADSKEKLWNIAYELRKMIESKKLTVKKNYKIAPTRKTGIDFVGYRIFNNRILLRKTLYKKAKKRLKYLKNKEELSGSQKSSVGAYLGWLDWTTCEELKKKLGVNRK